MTTVPSIAVTDALPFEAVYVEDRIYIKNPDNCKVMAHEFVHHLQYLSHGNAKSHREWWSREVEAMMLAEQIMECK